MSMQNGFQTDVRHGTSVAVIKQSFLDHLFGALGRSLEAATLNDQYLALALTVRERVFETGEYTLEAYRNSRAVAYLSAEYFPDRILRTISWVWG